MARGVRLGVVLICLLHAASVSCLLKTRAKLFQTPDGNAAGGGGLERPAEPQDQLRRAWSLRGRPSGGYAPPLSQTAQNGRPSKAPRPSWPVTTATGGGLQERRAAVVERRKTVPARTGQNPPRGGPQAPPTRPKSSSLFIDGVPVRMQTSARGRGRKVGGGGGGFKRSRFASAQGQWLQGRYRPVPEGALPGRDLTSSRFFNGAQNPTATAKRPPGSPGGRRVATQVYQIPKHLGGFAIRRLKAPADSRASPRMHRGRLRDGGRRV